MGGASFDAVFGYSIQSKEQTRTGGVALLLKSQAKPGTCRPQVGLCVSPELDVSLITLQMSEWLMLNSDVCRQLHFNTGANQKRNTV